MAGPSSGLGRGEEFGSQADESVEAELALADSDERLPWLESDDDFEPAGVDTGRIVVFAAVGLLVIVLLLGVLWWALRDNSGQELVADGSVIEAPETPYKTRPDNPGGLQVEGTGDTSFEVAEGKEIDGRIAGSGEVVEPSIDREQAAGEGEDAPAPVARGIGVQVGAYSTKEQAEAGWNTLSGRFAALQGRNHRVVQGIADSGTIFRLQALAGSADEADTLCRALKSQGGDCQVKR
ncbi:MAG: SPOR domain-containing protein [Porphyrobacter sp.]|nr:SPOR domain-containing protein [Porphyrobacter sp.]